MKRIFILTLFAAALILSVIQPWRQPPTSAKAPVPQAEATAYWTCPMHPQVHTDHAGECPICHMKLVPMQSSEKKSEPETQSRGSVSVTAEQMQLTGTQRTEVEKMNLRMQIPVSGRFISSSSVAFQIYESDLSYIHSGLAFKGASSFFPKEEITGTITSVDSIVDPTSRTVRVVGTVKNGPRGTPAETGFRGQIEFVLKDRLAIPESSVLHRGTGDLVYVFSGENHLEPRAVKLGLKAESFYDVLEGLKVGEWISSGPNFLIDSESQIRALSAPQKGSAPQCPSGEHWDIPMAMCMPGESK